MRCWFLILLSCAFAPLSVAQDEGGDEPEWVVTVGADGRFRHAGTVIDSLALVRSAEAFWSRHPMGRFALVIPREAHLSIPTETFERRYDAGLAVVSAVLTPYLDAACEAVARHVHGRELEELSSPQRLAIRSRVVVVRRAAD
ncbi:MAG: hypothetical protein AAGI52_16300 [Bacteroidota bacterium]